MNTVEFAQGLFDTHPLPNNDGYVWTLTSRIGDMLWKAEKLFGPRDISWTILGVEACLTSECPRNWYPGSHYGRKNIVFQIVPPADKDIVCANYQLSHEVIHALSPGVVATTNILEEGLATWFSVRYTKENFGVEISPELDSYKEAYNYVNEVLVQDLDVIRRLRAIEPSFRHMTLQTFAAAGSKCPIAIIERLLQKFVRS